ncbi:hypothetical protein BEN78_10095 [Xanthomonas citri pv. mangiferaeindicae]|nr:hypothetical protein BEN78_10095 [Xanthomonas citri pv. mangiferaeindicae]
MVEAGAAAAVEVDPLMADAMQLDALAPAAIVVALEPSIAEALDALAPVLAHSGRTVVFEEADRVLERGGDDASHWVRRLGAKLRLREAPQSGPEATQTDEASGVSSAHAAYAFDPVAAEYDDAPAMPHAPFALDFDVDFAADDVAALPVPAAVADSVPAAGSVDTAERDHAAAAAVPRQTSTCCRRSVGSPTCPTRRRSSRLATTWPISSSGSPVWRWPTPTATAMARSADWS